MARHNVQITLDIDVVLDTVTDGYIAWSPMLRGFMIRGGTEEQALENARTASETFIRHLIKHSNTYPEEAVQNLNRSFGHGKFQNLVLGCIKSTIAAHGPITEGYANSVSKRVSSQLWAVLQSVIKEGVPKCQKQRIV